jgi:chromosome transmission fidelity protein 1
MAAANLDPSFVRSNKRQQEKYPTGNTVPFPFETPYPQQIDLINTVLKSLDLARRNRNKSGLGAGSPSCSPILMIESPTGTGKSLSIACAAMAWLRFMEKEDMQRVGSSDVEISGGSTENLASSLVDKTGVDWLDNWKPQHQRETERKLDSVKNLAIESRRRLEDELTKIRDEVRRQSEVTGQMQAARRHVVRSAVASAKAIEKSNPPGRCRRKLNGKLMVAIPSYDFDLYPYNSDDEDRTSLTDSEMLGNGNQASSISQRKNFETKNLLRGSLLDGSSAFHPYTDSADSQKLASRVPTLGNVFPGSGVRKIVYASRTHSQLSQFIAELKRTSWGNTVRVVALGGRKALCGNHDVRNKNEMQINDACLDLQKSKSKSFAASLNTRDCPEKDVSNTCPLLSSINAVETLALYNIAHPTDIEEAARIGDLTQTCSYYASRVSLHAAEVVVLPYNILFSKHARDSVGLSLQEAFVIVDEAHNLPEVLRSLHSCRLPLPTIEIALSQLTNYIKKYANRLAGRNIYYLGQIKRILALFEKYLNNNKKVEAMQSVSSFLISLNLDNVNLFKILRYLRVTGLSQKLLGFVHEKEQDVKESIISKHISAMSVVQNFLEKLSLYGDSGRVVSEYGQGGVSALKKDFQHPEIRFVLLTPSTFFENVLQEAHALALVGGTLTPFAHIAAELLGNQNSLITAAARADDIIKQESVKSNVSTHIISPEFSAFSCDHVISPNNILLRCISRGPTNKILDFRHQNRYKDELCDELALQLIKICQVVPHGVVVFFPSYSFEFLVVCRWKESGRWNELLSIKTIHREPKKAKEVEMSLLAYATDAKQPTGAMLLSIVGGKMSEGINFSNEMARCVVVVGVPYPDRSDPELKEKMKMMDSCGLINKAVSGASYYHNLCMRAINQSAGRAIRHSCDFASVILLDRRYREDSRIWNGLPGWMRRGIAEQVKCEPSGQIDTNDLVAFYASHGR